MGKLTWKWCSDKHNRRASSLSAKARGDNKWTKHQS